MNLTGYAEIMESNANAGFTHTCGMTQAQVAEYHRDQIAEYDRNLRNKARGNGFGSVAAYLQAQADLDRYVSGR